jgi:hypothetical protein
MLAVFVSGKNCPRFPSLLVEKKGERQPSGFVDFDGYRKWSFWDKGT